jgi:CRISPR/Cas system-associated endonuclease/helicase Cas3
LFEFATGEKLNNCNSLREILGRNDNISNQAKSKIDELEKENYCLKKENDNLKKENQHQILKKIEDTKEEIINLCKK